MGALWSITDLLRRSEKRLLKLFVTGSSEESNVRKNVQRSLATDLQNISIDIRRKQSTYLKRLTQKKEGHGGIDLEMNFNENRFRLEVDGFSDVGTIVDCIDNNIQSVATSVEEGFKQLQKAETTQNGGIVMCAAMLVIMCLVMLVFLILKELLF